MNEECPICCEEYPLLVVTSCCVQKMCAQCKLKCASTCPFCRTVHIQIEEVVPVVSIIEFPLNKKIFTFCMVVIVMWIIRFVYILIAASIN